MFEKIDIKNYQVHKNRTIVFDEHITVITGRTDKGKSAVVRAIRWLATNRPAGNSFIREGADGAGVRLTVDGFGVVRTKREGRNIYAIDKKVFKAFGSGVPTEVETLLNISPINFQRQHDPTFWFSDKPIDVCRNLNAIVNLEIIDRVLQDLGTRKRRAATVVNVCEERLTQAKAAKKDFSYAIAFDESLQDVETLENHAKLKATQAARTRKAAARVAELAANADKAAAMALGGRVVLRLGAKAGRTQSAAFFLRKSLIEVRKNQIIADKTIPKKQLDALGKKMERALVKWQTAAGAHVFVDEIKKQRDGYIAAAEQFKTSDAKLKTYKGQECPVCGGVL